MSSVTGAMCVTVYRCISITPPRAREVTKLPQRFAGSWVLMLNAVKFLFWRQKMPQSQKYQCFKWKVKQSKYLHPPPTLPGNKAFPTQGGGGGVGGGGGMQSEVNWQRLPRQGCASRTVWLQLQCRSWARGGLPRSVIL